LEGWLPSSIPMFSIPRAEADDLEGGSISMKKLSRDAGGEVRERLVS